MTKYLRTLICLAFTPVILSAQSSDLSKPGDVLINEVMANPKGLTELPETEYVEIYNASDKALTLNGWSFIYDKKAIPIPDATLPAGGYALLYREGRDISAAQGALKLGISKFPANMANKGKYIAIKNADGTLIHELNYPKAKAAKSYERAEDNSWHLSTDPRGGTPGSVNSSPTSPEPPTPDPPTPQPPTPPEPPVQPDLSKPGDVLINEVMANPKGLMELPETEYVEIYNASDKALTLNGWTFIYDKKAIPIPDATLPAGGYALLYREGRDISAAQGALNLGISKFPANMANKGKYIAVKNADGTLIHELNYPKAIAGKSHERAADNSWHPSTDPRGGTPGSINSSPTSPEPPTPDPPTPQPPTPTPPEPPVQPEPPTVPTIKIKPGEIVFNEILPDPRAGGSEYIELYNRSERILPVSGLAITTRKANGTLGTFYSLKSVKDSILPNNHMVLTSNRNGVSDFYHTPFPTLLYQLKLPALNNSGATLVILQEADSSIIDEVSYSSKWHDTAIKNVKGVSLERIRPDSDSQNASNWTSAAAEAGYGTPGYKNSQFKNPDAENKMLIYPPEYINTSDHYTIRYQTNKTGCRCRIEIYSTNGKKQAEIANNQLLTSDGAIRWDGKGLDGGRLSPGVYIFFAELYHPDGDRKQTKKAFLIH